MIRIIRIAGLFVFGITGGLFATAGLAHLIIQPLLWLRDGFWTPMEFRSALSFFGVSEPDLEWRGPQMIVTWVLEWPLALGLIVTGAAIALAGGLMAS
jgi:hypothetical protein